jgi:hypothetical protein
MMISPSFLLLLSTDEYVLVIITILYLNLSVYLFNKITTQKFKFKLRIQKTNLEILEFKFQKELKYKVIDIIHLIRYTNKAHL